MNRETFFCMLCIILVNLIAARKVLKDKIRARDNTYSIESGTDLLMCKAVVNKTYFPRPIFRFVFFPLLSSL